MQLGMDNPADNRYSYSSAEQRFAIPAESRATLSLWYYVPQGGGRDDYSYLLVRPDGGTWRILRIVRDRTDGWVPIQEDVSHYA